MPHEVIMPALGMAQDAGRIVAWHKSAGDPVCEGDVLFEVETDKATMEVEALGSGFLTSVRAQAGEDVPVGQIIALIADTADETAPNAAVASTTAEASGAPARDADVAAEAEPAKTEVPTHAVAPAEAKNDRILSSPKAKFLAHKRGLDLAKLVRAGITQPIRAQDVEAFAERQEMPLNAIGGSRRATAQVSAVLFDDFAAWVAEQRGGWDVETILVLFASASLGRQGVIVEVEAGHGSRCYAVDGTTLAGVRRLEKVEPADIRLRDLRGLGVTALALGSEDVPVVTLFTAGGDIGITLECAASQLSAGQAVWMLTGLAARVRQPLRHLL